ncbi:Hypothetical protein BQ3484_295 [Cedratvirus A11]|uniref:Uncharacterized protein n=1 Tax=Cedratvirus A11 TaxID=1903266 RepID=A0A1M7XUJ6_9VIRU|nr:Hypothetical protein BQ3484_295 [Cedratvirus A11]SHO33363.1 Hypothetical protein BQ3484_295 [Cedratvirus A11]
MHCSSQVYFTILQNTDIPNNAKAFVKFRSVCRLFRDLSTNIGTPIVYSYETLSCLRPDMAHITNYMFFSKPLSQNLVVPDKVRKLQFTPSGDPNVVVSGGHLNNLTITGYIRDKKRFLPKLLFESIDTLYIGDFDLQEHCLPPTQVKHLHACGSTEAKAFASYLASVCSNLQSLKLYSGHRPLVKENIFSNLVCIYNTDLGELSIENFPKILVLVNCKVYKPFFSKTCNLICKVHEGDKTSICRTRSTFPDKTDHYLVMLLDNFTEDLSEISSQNLSKIFKEEIVKKKRIENPYRDKRGGFSLEVHDVEDSNLTRLLSWIRLTRVDPVIISSSVGQEKKSKLQYMIKAN